MNPYFVWEDHAPGEGWRPFTELHDPAVAVERVEVARRTLVTMFGLDPAVVPPRVVASVTFLGVASRLLAPPLVTPRYPAPEQLYWKPVPAGPWPMACTAPPAGGASVGAYRDRVVLGLVGPLLEVFRAAFRLSPKVLWGNVSSALAGAAGQLGDPAAWATLAELLTVAPLAGTADLHGRALRRRNCCLYYRIPGGGTCGDCVLRPAP
ncbi:(2Fe-2S)-binding protein [Dactylosporangium aurantiacum]|uniref:(2Fe-2S)-binding protein n=1 Tax=Dactylosporangium aurantiacum TaxID=35754 RepID=A0A9Q9IH79_9ACTN|nr:(2Fe-2S)-binding protein [Dactylosporangium aurantiacum]MDG6102633.1 (2Fe-2S)-binding protein [Dactylosporangium aurantiacum]UWZ53113.1 (2Fe-2S)-binding protein [Dactylosporangium aurantiacum]